MADINLIPAQEKANVKFELLRKRLQLFSIVILVGAAVFTVATLFLFTYFASANSSLAAQVEQDSAKVNLLKGTEELLLVVGDKATAASTVLSGRQDYPNFFQKLSALVPQNLYFTDMRVAEGKVVISGKARTSADVAGLANSLLSAKGAELVSGVSVDSLSSDDSGIYTFVISASIVGANTPSVSNSTQSGTEAGL